MKISEYGIYSCTTYPQPLRGNNKRIPKYPENVQGNTAPEIDLKKQGEVHNK